MDIAIITGANTRIGLVISRKLIEIGCRVYGLGSNFSDFPFKNPDFIRVTCDLTNTEHLSNVVQEILNKEKNIYVLVNHARYINLGPHEKLGLNELESLVHTNLLAPLILTRLALPSLIRLRGYILNIGFPDLPGGNRLGSAFLSTEVALKQFSERLYEEVRKDKVKVCSLILDTANAESMFNEGFTERENHDITVCSEAAAQAVEFVINQKRESVVSTMMVRPQKRESDIRDQADTRRLADPNPYSPKRAAKKVVIGHLKREKKPETREKPPATYMDMAREVAKEESRITDQPGNKSVAKSRQRRRSRRSRCVGDNKEKNVSAENSSNPTIEVSKRRERKAVQNRNKSRIKKSTRNNSSGNDSSKIRRSKKVLSKGSENHNPVSKGAKRTAKKRTPRRGPDRKN